MDQTEKYLNALKRINPARWLVLIIGIVGVTALLAFGLPRLSGPEEPAGGAPTIPTLAPVSYPLKLAAPDCSYGGEFKSIEAPDANTFVFDLCNPDAAFPAKIAFASNEILSRAVLDATGGDSAKISAAPVGTGPMVLKEWEKGDHLTFSASPNYWGDTPTIKTLIFKWSKTSNQRLLELQAGSVDAIELVGPEDIPALQQATDLKYYPIPAAITMFFAMNNNVPPFDQEPVRQAFAMAIDKQRIVKNFYPPGSTVADQFLYPGLKPGYSDGYPWYDFDPARARQMLAEAGFDFSQTIPFSCRSNSRPYVPNPTQVAEDVQAQLAQIGVKIKVDVQESSTFVGNAGAGKLGFFLYGWSEDYPDATNWFDYHFGPSTKLFGSPYPDLVAAIQQGAHSTYPVERQQAYDQVNTLIKQHVPMIPISHTSFGDGFKASVKNVLLTGNNQNFPYMQTDSGQLVWLQTSEPISLWCGDETEGETIHACMLLNEPLLRYQYGTSRIEPALADRYETNPELTRYTFHLRPNVRWSDGTAFSAADVFATFAAQWDSRNPDHTGNSGVFEYFGGFFGSFLK